MSSWWKRFKPNQSTLPAAAIATAICGVCLLAIWTQTSRNDAEVKRYGAALAQTLAHANAGALLHQERITLAVIANQVSQYPEVAGVVFYNAANEIIALAGNTERGARFPAVAAMDDTITGSVTVVLVDAQFAPPARPWAWLLSLLTLAAAPFISLGLMQLSARGNRSLPIVSVPEAHSTTRQPGFCLTVNLYNQLSLPRDARSAAIADAMNLATEVCAVHQGVSVQVSDRGVIVLFDQNSVSAGQAVCASFLLQRLLNEYETDGTFRCYLNQVECPGAPAEIAPPDLSELQQDIDVDNVMTLAALAKPQTVLLAEEVYAQLGDHEKVWARVFSHPLLADVDDNGHTYLVSELPDQQLQLVESQAMLILGFSQASA